MVERAERLDPLHVLETDCSIRLDEHPLGLSYNL